MTSTSTARKKMIPSSRSWAFSEKTRPLYIIGQSNVVGRWSFFDCDHAVQRCVERGTRYEKGDLKVVVALDLEAVFTSGLVDTPEFCREFRTTRGGKLRRAQIRDCNNDTISAIVEIDADNREVFLVTVVAPKEEGLKVAGKRNYLLNICESDGDAAKLVFSDNSCSVSRVIASCFIENTAWL